MKRKHPIHILPKLVFEGIAIDFDDCNGADTRGTLFEKGRLVAFFLDYRDEKINSALIIREEDFAQKETRFIDRLELKRAFNEIIKTRKKIEKDITHQNKVPLINNFSEQRGLYWDGGSPTKMRWPL
jgi:hypothetical protein